MSGASKSLAGRRVAVTRGKGGDDPLSRRLRALGAEVLDVPAVVTGPPTSWEALDAALRELAGFGWIAFASATAVERFAGRLSALGLPPPPRATRLAAVGSATAARVRELLREPDLVPPVATGEALAAALAPAVGGLRVLVPRAEEGRPELVEGLAAAGATVVAAPCYRTVAAPPDRIEPLAAALAAGRLDAVAFAAPSAVRSVLDGLGDRVPLLSGCALAAIGSTTAAALREAGFAVAVMPADAGAEPLADAIAAHLGPRAGEPAGRD